MIKLKHNSIMKKYRVVTLLSFAVLLLATFSSIPSRADSSNNTPAPKPVRYCDAGGGIDWLICPIINLATFGADAGYKLLEDWLVLDTEFLGETTKPDSSTNNRPALRELWSSFRDIANIVLIISFLIMVISYVTGYGLNNYQIKTMLPKLIIAALLINLSYYITQLAIDLSNLIGSSVRELFSSFLQQSTSGAGGLKAKDALALPLITTGGFIANRFTPLKALILPIIITIAMLVLTALFMMLLRQAVAIVVIVLAPLAFASSLLPSTEKLFENWKKGLMAVILAYPVISLVFSAGQLAGSIINSAADGNILLEILAGLSQVVPIVLVPSMLNQSINRLPVIGAAASNWAKGLNKKAISTAKTSDLNKNIRNRWEKRKTARELAASRPGAGVFRRLASPIAATRGSSRLGRERRQNLERQQELEAQNIASNMDLSDAQTLANFTQTIENIQNNSTLSEKSRRDLITKTEDDLLSRTGGLSQRGRDMFAAAGGKKGGAFSKMSLAAANVLSREAGSNPEAYNQLTNYALKNGMSSQQVENFNAKALDNTTRSGNIALRAMLDDAKSRQAAALDMANVNNIYSNYLQNANQSEIAGASAESIDLMGTQIENLTSTNPAFKSSMQRIVTDPSVNSSIATRMRINSHIR